MWRRQKDSAVCGLGSGAVTSRQWSRRGFASCWFPGRDEASVVVFLSRAALSHDGCSGDREARGRVRKTR
jgi:hypothetical protein